MISFLQLYYIDLCFKKSKEDYLKSSNETFDYVEAYFMDSPLNQLYLTKNVFKLRVKIHEYFDQDFQMESCKKVLTDAIKEERMLVIWFLFAMNLQLLTLSS